MPSYLKMKFALDLSSKFLRFFFVHFLYYKICTTNFVLKKKLILKFIKIGINLY